MNLSLGQCKKPTATLDDPDVKASDRSDLKDAHFDSKEWLTCSTMRVSCNSNETRILSSTLHAEISGAVSFWLLLERLEVDLSVMIARN